MKVAFSSIHCNTGFNEEFVSQFAESMMTLLANAMENFVLLLIKSCVDGPQSCERVVQAIIEQMVEDVDFPPPTVGQVIAHLR